MTSPLSAKRFSYIDLSKDKKPMPSVAIDTTGTLLNAYDKLPKDKKVMYKIAMLGDCAVGKTMLSWSSTQPSDERVKDLPSKPTTICAGFVELYSSLPDSRIARTVVWDTAGQERYAEMTRTYMNGADALILVFDVTKTSSFDSITSRWLEVIEEQRRINDQLVVILVANKIDLENTRCVNARAARECADSLGFEHYLETSALLRSTVHEMFNYTIAAVWVAQKEAAEHKKDHASTVRLNATANKSKSSCCS